MLALISGVLTGMQMTAEVPRRCAASATPCAWLPADEQMTPAVSCSGVRLAILLKAPRNLNEKTGCRSSRLNQMLLPLRALSCCASSSGVSTYAAPTFGT